jgi:hypothetical protein
MAYETTTVAVEKSQGEIRGLLAKHKAQRFAFGEESGDDGRQWAAVTFSHGGFTVRMRVPHKALDRRKVSDKANRATRRTFSDVEAEMAEQEAKRIWRVMAWNLKARLVAVEEELETFEEAFLAHLIDPSTGETIYEQLRDTGCVTLASPLLALPAVREAVA